MNTYGQSGDQNLIFVCLAYLVAHDFIQWSLWASLSWMFKSITTLQHITKTMLELLLAFEGMQLTGRQNSPLCHGPYL
jgi:hypothetical protein